MADEGMSVESVGSFAGSPEYMVVVETEQIWLYYWLEVGFEVAFSDSVAAFAPYVAGWLDFDC